MEEGNIGELIDEAIETWCSELVAIEIDGGNGGGREIVRWVAAVKAFVATHI